MTFLEHDERVCAPRARLGARAIRWGWPGLVLWTGPGRTLRKWKDALDANFDTGGAGNGPTEAINGIIELGRRTARGYRNPTNYQLRMLLIAGGLDASTHTQLGRAPFADQVVVQRRISRLSPPRVPQMCMGIVRVTYGYFNA